jgi:hypothetical protein
LNNVGDIRTLIKINKDGVYEWIDPEWNTMFLDYFEKRKDDDLSNNSLEDEQVCDVQS